MERISDETDFEKTLGEEFYRKIDRSRLRDGTVGGVMLLIRLCFIAMMASVAGYHKNPDKEEEIRQEYKKALSIFCYGACRDSEKNQVEEN